MGEKGVCLACNQKLSAWVTESLLSAQLFSVIRLTLNDGVRPIQLLQKYNQREVVLQGELG